MAIVPATRPRMSTAELAGATRNINYALGSDPIVVVGIRGYYRDSMGVAGQNDRGVYDDALFLHSSDGTVAFNANTDPSTIRKGLGTGAEKGMASLIPGVWRVHRFDLHKASYLALCQRAGPVTVMRDGDPPYLDTGDFGINIHRGNRSGTASEGCTTVHPDQWDAFINLSQDLATRVHGDAWKSRVVPYVLIDGAPEPLAQVLGASTSISPLEGVQHMTDLNGFTAGAGPLTITLNGNFQTLGALGIYSWSPGQGNQWTVVHKDTQWAPFSGPHTIPALAPGSKLLWIVGLVTTANPPAPVAATVVVAAQGNQLDVTPVTGIATATTPVQQQKMYNL